MYFKIEKTGCTEDRGLVQIRYDLFLDEGDYKYLEYFVECPIFPEEGYPGRSKEGIIDDIEAYKRWAATLPTQWINTPFCCHLCQFEPNATNEEILFVGELVLDMGYKNFKLENLQLNKNVPVTFSMDDEKKSLCESRVEEIKATDFSSIETIGTYSVRTE